MWLQRDTAVTKGTEVYSPGVRAAQQHFRKITSLSVRFTLWVNVCNVICQLKHSFWIVLTLYKGQAAQDFYVQWQLEAILHMLHLVRNLA